MVTFDTKVGAGAPIDLTKAIRLKQLYADSVVTQKPPLDFCKNLVAQCIGSGLAGINFVVEERQV